MTTKSSIVCDQNLPAVQLSNRLEAAWFIRLQDRQTDRPDQSLNPLLTLHAVIILSKLEWGCPHNYNTVMT